MRALPKVDCDLPTEGWHDDGTGPLGWKAVWSYVSFCDAFVLLCDVFMSCVLLWLVYAMLVSFECDYLVIDMYVVIFSFPYVILGMLCIGSAGGVERIIGF